ncbi:dihydrolipoamide dehydrogenase [Caldicellulosiruptor bescii]|uniref:Dihydrolipoyl dehydrogenase n=2 Tax=Caldicellulosiruptor bescii TaxID=31899 RepID=B9MQ26_CALBD|nr:dihydrolipoyl dehydrogenase [Caldicellulosiruptor bescii]ACM59818.1 dihydrolipoamide dehydrogenase [Caldicellulosiruptor bescii DSM 6725]PBC87228.1 dihydrolipoamide dehydrogenase [Caldicellulosiruptor bescii]PBC90167.1 dihydrolipoamide dehydrogenase [Caldicellulosiruptor bescii]PBD04403.1 dihydrolipoamide dehydrogenase [Caldicellulosiruptor bescii]PBD05964.1 dihydrolipoamide dehydrogenase [Caldicellulosiruptor bescii]
MKYDLIIIGGGPAGYLAAERASKGGIKTLLIEERYLGGVCLNEGCIPTKTLLYSAKILEGAKHGFKYGVEVKNITLNHKKVLERKDKVIKTLMAGIKSKLRKSGAEILSGHGEILGRNSKGYIVAVGDKEFATDRLLIATGSSPFIPPIEGVKEGLERGFVLASREILEIESVPASMVVIGGGIVGLEMASYFNSAGSKVTVIEMLDHIGGSMDREISNILLEAYKKKGVEFELSARVTKIDDRKVVYEKDGKIFEKEAEKVLLSVGRRPNITGFGLENIGVEIEKGCIKTDERMKTNVQEVYAAGDVNGKLMLAHTAYREAEVAVWNMLGRRVKVNYNSIPSVVYTNPEVAWVGESEESAKEKGLEYEVTKLPMLYSGRFVAENEEFDGLCKILIDRKKRTILGCHMIGNYSSEIIFGVGVMIEAQLRVEDIKDIVFPHPTVSEIIREVIFEL